MSLPVIQVQNLSKRYRIGLKEKRHDTFAQQILATIKAPIQNFRQLRSMSKFGADDESIFWALRDINFEVKQGEVLGIIGHNGAGKSTLLKILSKITEPTAGEIRIKGRIAALLEVGTGFHQDLTGRENIYMNGTILGMSKKEIDRKLDEIIDFSGVEKYVDTPVKFYSSGMKVRLGFAVAAHLEPEILIIDEVLAVGDVEFQKKCLQKMEDVSQSHGKTLLFVSHNMASIRSICNRCIVLQKSEIIFDGEVSEGIKNYAIEKTTKKNEDYFYGVVVNNNEKVYNDDTITVKFKSKFTKSNYSGYLFFILTDAENEVVVHSRVRIEEFSKEMNEEIEIRIGPLCVRPGVYSFHLKVILETLNDKARFVSDNYLLDIQIKTMIDLADSIGYLTPLVKWK